MTSPEPSKDRSTLLLICLSVVTLALIGLYAWEQATAHDTSTTLGLLGLAGAAVFGVAQQNRSNALRADVAQVKVQTNGNTSRLLDMIERFGESLAVSAPIPPAELPPGTTPVLPPAPGPVIDARAEAPAPPAHPAP